MVRAIRSMDEPQQNDGIVIDITTVNTIHNVEPDRIVVEAGVTWGCTTGSSIAHPAK